MICSSGITFDPRVGGRRLTFGFHGIWQGTAVLYDHGTGSHWMHFTGACYSGAFKGETLAQLRTGRHTTWADWRAGNPQTDVLKPQARWSGQPEDGGYFPEAASRAGLRFLPPQFVRTIQTRDARLRRSDLLHGVVVGTEARAFPHAQLARQPVVNTEVGGQPISVWFDARVRSAAAYHCRIGARTLTFQLARPGVFTDRETGSEWSLDGRCVRGRLKATRLKSVFGLQAEWYGWFAHHPKTTVWGP